MTTSASDLQSARASSVTVTDDELTVELADGRTLAVPLAWYPRLVHGTRRERSNSRLIGGGIGIHWPDLDEDISVEGLLGGKHSGEAQTSLEKWLAARAPRRSRGPRPRRQ